MSEKRPKDSVDQALRLTTDAAELVEHLRDDKNEAITDGREILYNAVIELVDEAHQECLEASVALEEND